MSGFSENLTLAIDSLRAHKMRAALTVLGLTMGVATLITVMTLVQGANLYVEQKIANLGVNVFRIGRLPFALTDFSVLAKAQRNRYLYQDDMEALVEGCPHCETVGASLSSNVSLRYKDRQMDDATLYGYTPSMALIDTRNVAAGPLLHRVGGPPRRRGLPDRRQGGAGSLPRHRPAGAGGPRRAPTSSPWWARSSKSAPCWARIRTVSWPSRCAPISSCAASATA